MRKFTSNKDFNVYIQELCRTGWVYIRGKKHAKLIAPTGAKVVVPGSPSDRRAFDNFKRDVKICYVTDAV